MRSTTLARLGLALGLAACGDAPTVSLPVPSEGRALPSVNDSAQAAPVARVEQADGWLDLVAQRPSAVQRWGGAVVVDLGTEHARKHIALTGRGLVQLAQDIDGTAAGLVMGRSMSLELPIDGDLAPKLHEKPDGEPGLAVAIDVKAFAPDQQMTVLLGERPLAHLRLGTTWERRTVSLPPDLVTPAENTLRLHFRRVTRWPGDVEVSAAVSRVELGTVDRIVKPPDEHRGPVYDVEPDDQGGSAISLPAGGALAWYVVPPTRGKLYVSARGKGALTVLASTDADHRSGKTPTILLDEPLRETGRRSKLDLSAWGGVPLRLEVQVRGRDLDAVAHLDEVMVGAPRTVPVDRRARKARDVIIVGVEGLRADALTMGKRPPLPRLEELAARSLRFEQAYALTPAAVPSHASWLTSVVPPAHLTVRGTFVAQGRTSLAEALGRASYFRTLVSANADVNDERGLLQGFDAKSVLGGKVEDDGALAVIRGALASVAERSGRWLVLANVNDPQAPYEPPRDFVRELEPPRGAPMAHLTHIWVGRVRLGKLVPSPAELEYIRGLYRGEVRVVDEALGELLDTLAAKNRLESAIVVVLGVHGEEFFEHGSAGHDRSLYRESLQVPVLIHAPELLAPGRVTAPVDLLDLAPTLTDLLGLPPVDDWQGESLVPIIDDPDPSPRLIVAYLGDGSRTAIASGHKYMLGPGRNEEFYDLAADPGEREDIVATGGIALRMVRTALGWQVAHETRWRRPRWGTGANLRPAFALDQGM